ncbi:unnamed protein product [Lota lota]
MHSNTFNAEKDMMSRERQAFRLEVSEVSMLRKAHWKEKRGIQTTREASYNEPHYIKTQNMAQMWNTVNSNHTSPEARPGSEWELHVFQ